LISSDVVTSLTLVTNSVNEFYNTLEFSKIFDKISIFYRKVLAFDSIIEFAVMTKTILNVLVVFIILSIK